MRLLHWLLALAGALLLGAWLAPRLGEDPGYVLVRFQGWAFETSATALAVALIAILLAWRLAAWLLRLPGRAARRAAAKRREARLERGLLALAEGRWSQAEKLLAAEARQSREPAVAYLVAARAAQAHGDESRREDFLALAQDAGEGHELAVALTRAELLLAEGEAETAAAVLEPLLERHRRNARLLHLLAESYRALERWAALDGLVPALGKLPEVDRAGLEREVAIGRFQQAPDSDALERAWSGLSRRARADVVVMRRWAERALALGDDARVAQRLPRFLRRQWDPALVRLYGRADHPEPSAALRTAEGWLKSHGDDDSLLLALGLLCRQAGLSGKARQYLEQSLSLEVRPETLHELAELLDASGDAEGAMACFRRLAVLAGEEEESGASLPGTGGLGGRLAPPGDSTRRA